jgi:hemerythrin-like domain-containing protein
LDVITLLKADHQVVKKLLKQLEETTERATKTRQELFARVQHELKVHEAIEEEIVYPAFREKARMQDIVLESYQEHHVVNLIMEELSDESVNDETWGPKLKVMQENVEHHVEEEEGKMFPMARKLFSDAELKELGEQAAARKQELKSDSLAA